MMVADNGSAWYISGAPDSRWNDDDLHNLGKLTGADFEVVDVSPLMVNENSGQARRPRASGAMRRANELETPMAITTAQ